MTVAGVLAASSAAAQDGFGIGQVIGITIGPTIVGLSKASTEGTTRSEPCCTDTVAQ